MKTKVYFVTTENDNEVIYTLGNKGKSFGGNSQGKWCGVDLYAPDTVEQLKKLIYENDYNNMTQPDVEFRFNKDDYKTCELIAVID